jgi:hypothetical protein
MVLLIGVVMLQLLASAGLAEDWRERNQELDRLLTFVGATSTTVNEYLAAERLALSDITTAEPSRKRAGAALLLTAAAHAEMQLKSYSALTETLRTVSWHGANKRALRDFKAYIAAWLRFYDSIVEHRFGMFGSLRQNVTSKLRALRQALLSAIPPWPRYNLRSRVREYE